MALWPFQIGDIAVYYDAPSIHRERKFRRTHLADVTLYWDTMVVSIDIESHQ